MNAKKPGLKSLGRYISRSSKMGPIEGRKNMFKNLFEKVFFMRTSFDLIYGQYFNHQQTYYKLQSFHIFPISGQTSGLTGRTLFFIYSPKITKLGFYPFGLILSS